MGRARLGTLYKKTPDAKRWTAAFTHPVSGARIIKTLYADKQASRAALDRMLRDTERCAEGLEDPHAEQRRRPIGEHVEEYLDHCRHQQQAPRHILGKARQLKNLVIKTGALRIDDLTLEAVEGVLRELIARGRSARTHNHHRGTYVAFMNWAVRTGRVPSHLLARVPVLDERADRRRHRRALTTEELIRLLKAARWRPLAEFGRGVIKRPSGERSGRRTWTRAPLAIGNLGAAVEGGRAALASHPAVQERLDRLGRERELIYKTLVLTGLRKGELASLRVADLHLDHKPAYAVLQARADKARVGAEIPLRADLAAELRGWVAGLLEVAQRRARSEGTPIPARASPETRLFVVPRDLSRILDRDLRTAGIPKRDDRGYTVDVHALRHTFGTHLSRGGVLPRTAQAAMRHSAIQLTMNLYTDPRLLDVAAALDALPRLGRVEPHALVGSR